ncbi:unnamed protein product, partial [Symbiodinium sp. KB8]
GLLLARAVDKIEGFTEEGRDLARKVVLSTEYLARDFVLGVNLSGYLMSGTSYAPWFHIGKVYAAIKEKFPDLLQVMGEPPPSARRNALLAALKNYLEQEPGPFVFFLPTLVRCFAFALWVVRAL